MTYVENAFFREKRIYFLLLKRKKQTRARANQSASFGAPHIFADNN